MITPAVLEIYKYTEVNAQKTIRIIICLASWDLSFSVNIIVVLVSGGFSMIILKVGTCKAENGHDLR